MQNLSAIKIFKSKSTSPICYMSSGFQNLVRWCDSSPCKNGGTCWQRGTTYSCECETGWTGLYCDVPSVSCEVAAKQRGKTEIRPLEPALNVSAQKLTSSSLHHASSTQEWMFLSSVKTRVSVWTRETVTTATVRSGTPGATVRSR